MKKQEKSTRRQTRSRGPRVAGVLLAAGGSTRMARPKQLLAFEGEALVRRAARALLGSRCAAVYVVTGAHAAEVERALRDLDATPVRCEHWADGLAASIRAGVAALGAAAPPFDAVLLALADQPLVTSALHDRLIECFEREAGPAACDYAGGPGVPALFPRADFERLASLGGDRGARELLRGSRRLSRVPFPPAAVDVDTPEDYERLLREGGGLGGPRTAT